MALSVGEEFVACNPFIDARFADCGLIAYTGRPYTVTGEHNNQDDDWQTAASFQYRSNTKVSSRVTYNTIKYFIFQLMHSII